MYDMVPMLDFLFSVLAFKITLFLSVDSGEKTTGNPL